MQKEQILQNFGLTEAEVSIYLELLKLGESTASILAQKTSMNRTFTYDRLKKLGDLGLVSSIIKEHRKYFRPSEPTQLISILKEREEQVRSILSDLEKLKQPQKLGPEVEVYSTLKGVQTAINLMIKERKVIYLHGTIKRFQESMLDFFDIWNKRRIKGRIKLRILSNENIDLKLSESDILIDEQDTNTSTFTFGNTTLIIMWEDSPVAILIRSKEIAENGIDFFNSLWNREIKIYTGIKNIQKIFMNLLDDTKHFTGFAYSKQLSEIYTIEFSDKWHLERIKRNIPCRIIAYDNKETQDYFKSRIKEKKGFYVRYLPKELQGPACINFSEKMVATFVYTEKNLKVIVNKDKETIKVYKKYFNELWIKSKTN